MNIIRRCKCVIFSDTETAVKLKKHTQIQAEMFRYNCEHSFYIDFSRIVGGRVYSLEKVGTASPVTLPHHTSATGWLGGVAVWAPDL